MKVRDAMTPNVVTVAPATPIKDAAQILIERDFSALPVVDGENLVGIVTEADMIGLELADPRSRLSATAVAPPPPATVAGVMSQDVITVDEDADVATAAELMLTAAIKHLPVLRGNRLVGIISRHDIVKVIAAPDAGIEEDVRRLLVNEGVGLIGLAVHVDHGVVEVEGQADARTARLAGSLIRSVPGVLDVRFTPAADD